MKNKDNKTDIKINNYNYSEDCRNFEKKYGNVKYSLTRKQLRAMIPGSMKSSITK